jgi:hypothetical protein
MIFIGAYNVVAVKAMKLNTSLSQVSSGPLVPPTLNTWNYLVALRLSYVVGPSGEGSAWRTLESESRSRTAQY